MTSDPAARTASPSEIDGLELRRPVRHSLTTRLLHLLLAVAVIGQLADAQLMRAPRPERPASDTEAAVFVVHEYVGLATMTVIVLFWLWLLVRRFETDPGALFPWFSRDRLAALWADAVLHLHAATRLTLPDPDRSPALAPAIQGLGLVLVLILAVTGTLGFFAWTPGTSMAGFAYVVFYIHGTLANVLWAYLPVHVGAVVLHEVLGHRLLRRMLLLPDNAVSRPEVHGAECTPSR